MSDDEKRLDEKNIIVVGAGPSSGRIVAEALARAAREDPKLAASLCVRIADELIPEPPRNNLEFVISKMNDEISSRIIGLPLERPNSSHRHDEKLARAEKSRLKHSVRKLKR